MRNYSRETKKRLDDDLDRVDKYDNIEDFIYDKDKIVEQYLDLAEEVVRTHFKTSYFAIGVLSLNDLIQEAVIGLIAAAKNVDAEQILASTNPEILLKKFLTIRMVGAVKRIISRYSRQISMSYYMQVKVKNGDDVPDEVVAMFFDRVLTSISSTRFKCEYSSKLFVDINQKTVEYDINFMSEYISSLIKKNLDKDSANCLDWYFGLKGNVFPVLEVGEKLGLVGSKEGIAKQVEQMKSDAIHTLSMVVDRGLVADFFNESRGYT